MVGSIGSERLDEITDPEIAIERAINTYREKGYSEEWITQRIRSIEIRKDLTAEWDRQVLNWGRVCNIANEISKAYLKIKGKTYCAKTNSRGQATFKITNLNKKGTFIVIVKYAGNKYYNALKVKSKIVVK